MPRGDFAGSQDITSVEAYFSRSLKIRMGVLDCMGMLANQTDAGEATAFESLHDVAVMASNHVWLSGWDFRPCSSESAFRWVKQYTAVNGLFEAAETVRGGVVIHYRQAGSKRMLTKILKAHRPRRRRKGVKA